MAAVRMKVPELRDILKRKGIPFQGKKKEQLVLLVERSQGVYDDLEADDKLESERKRRCVSMTDGSGRVQLEGKQVTWDNNLSAMPSLKDGNVFAYLMHQCQWSWQRINSYQEDDGYKMCVDHHVESMRVGNIEEHTQHIYVEGAVKPEQRQMEQRYRTWVLISQNCQVMSGGCQCVAADDGTCKHVVCLLFSIADFWQQRRDRNPEVCTDLPMVWNKPRKESVPVKATELDFRKDKSTPKKPKPTPEQFKPLRDINDNDISLLREEICQLCRDSKPDALILTAVDPAPAKHHVPTLLDMAKKYKHEQLTCDFLTFIQSETDSQSIQCLQDISQDSLEWKDARMGRVTASVAGEVLHLVRGQSCINKILGTTAPIRSLAVEHGKSYEAVARALYTSREKTKHKQLVVEQFGFFVDQETPCLGASPDGAVSCACHESRLLEIKCTYKHRNISPYAIPQDKLYHLEMCDGELCIKKSSDWYYQTQFQMGIMKYSSCDLVIHTLQDIAVIHIDFDHNVWETLRNKAIQVFRGKVVPRLLDLC